MAKRSNTVLALDVPWEQKVEAVMKWKVVGASVEEIIAKTGLGEVIVQRILREKTVGKAVKDIKTDIINAAFEEKVPVLKEIVGHSLHAIRESLKELADPEVRKVMLSRMSDISSLANTLKGINELLRLELGQSTQNIDIKSQKNSYQETRIVLQELSKKDPVFSYPELPPVEESKDG